MAYYVKVNARVAELLGKTDCRRRLPDGSYLLWQADLLSIAPSYMLKEAAATVGGVVLTQAAAHEEYLGNSRAELPEPKDPIYSLSAATDATAEPLTAEPAATEPETEPEEEAEE